MEGHDQKAWEEFYDGPYQENRERFDRWQGADPRSQKTVFDQCLFLAVSSAWVAGYKAGKEEGS